MKAFGKDVDLPVDKLAKLTKNQRVAILGGTVLLLVAVFASLLAMPQRQKIQQLRVELQATSEELASVKATVARLDAFKAEMAEIEVQFKKALSLLPDRKEIPGLLSSISQVGGQCGLDFVLFKPKNEVPKQFYAEIPVEVKILGGYHDVARFFDKVSKLPRIVNISEVTMEKPKQSGTGDMILTAECLATTYKFIESPTDEPNQPKKTPPRS
jgi:type IV pilus assembly protein PilO